MSRIRAFNPDPIFIETIRCMDAAYLGWADEQRERQKQMKEINRKGV